MRTLLTRLWYGNVDLERPTQERFLVQASDGLVGFVHGREGHESESTGPVRVLPIHHNKGVNQLAVRREELVQIVVACTPIQIRDVDLGNQCFRGSCRSSRCSWCGGRCGRGSRSSRSSGSSGSSTWRRRRLRRLTTAANLSPHDEPFSLHLACI